MANDREMEQQRDEKKDSVIKEVDVVDFNSQNSAISTQVDELLGDLLFYLRQNKAMSTLMICRQIERIELKDNIAYLCSEKADIGQLMTTERNRLELEAFFKQKGLGFKIEEKKREISKGDLLKEFFGDKLIVE